MPEETKEQKEEQIDLAAARAALQKQKELEEQLTRERESAENRRKQYDLYRSQYENEIQRLRQQQSSGGGYEREASAQTAPVSAELNQMREELALVRLAQKHKDWEDKWPKVQELIHDNQRAAEVAVFDQQGNPDFYKSLNNAYTQIQLEELRKVQEASEEARRKQQQEQDRLKRQGPSGVAASEGEEQIDLDGLTSDQMLEKGLVQGPPNDPIRPLRRKGGSG